ncbi:MAG TPA: DUF3817 domain-containing protein [Baekduia sp.]|nr:DUF3817 domain-containing protein [Baekduia sp.]
MSDFSTEQLVRYFKIAAVVEAFTWAALLVGVYLKRVSETTDVGVAIAGPIHGAAFLAYLAITWVTADRLGWSGGLKGLALVADVPPFGTVVFEQWAAKRGQLDVK